MKKKQKKKTYYLWDIKIENNESLSDCNGIWTRNHLNTRPFGQLK